MPAPRLFLPFAAAVALAAPAAAQTLPDWFNKFSFSGTISSDLRFVIDNYRGATPGNGYYFDTNRNDLTLHGEFTPIQPVIAVIDLRLRFYGINTAATLPQLTDDRLYVDPFDLQADQAYVAVRGVPFSWMDIKIGRMIQHWGSADMFNPTDNLNARDFYDPMDYTRKVPNEMVELDFYPSDKITINAVWVPVFQPSILPPSSVLGFAIGRNSAGCVSSIPTPPLTPSQNQQLFSTFGAINPCSLNFATPQVNVVTPGNTIGDSQAGLRAHFKIGDLEMSLSYYYGRFSFPVAYDAAAFATTSEQSSAVNVNYIAEVLYPRMQVAGFDFSYSADWLLNIGFVGELAVIFPEEVVFGLGVYENGGKILQMSNINVPNTPFVKGTFGADYTFTKWLYMNVMYVRGFFDEFNDRYGIHNYAVAAAELKFHDNAIQLRLSGVLSLDDWSNVGYPQLTWVIVPGVEAMCGAFVYGGHTTPTNPDEYWSVPKFGQKAAGRSEAFIKGRFTW